MPSNLYQGFYCQFLTEDKKVGAQLMGADDLIGDLFEVRMVRDDADPVACIFNRFDKKTGYFDADITYKLQLCIARGMHISAILSGVCFSDTPDPGHYWGEVAILAYTDREKSAFDTFRSHVQTMLMDGTRVAVDLSEDSIASLIDSKGEWTPTDRVSPLKLEHGDVLLKSHRTFNEKMIELARQRKPGCMIIGWLFIIIVVTLIVILFKQFFG